MCESHQTTARAKWTSVCAPRIATFLVALWSSGAEVVYGLDVAVITPEAVSTGPAVVGGDWDPSTSPGVLMVADDAIQVRETGDGNSDNSLFGVVSLAGLSADFAITNAQIEVTLQVNAANAATGLAVYLTDLDSDTTADKFIYNFDLTAVPTGSVVTLTKPLTAAHDALVVPPLFSPGDGIENYGLTEIGFQSVGQAAVPPLRILNVDVKNVKIVDNSDPVRMRFNSATFEQPGNFTFDAFTAPGAVDLTGGTIKLDIQDPDGPGETDSFGGMGVPLFNDLDPSELRLEADVRLRPGNEAPTFSVLFTDKDADATRQHQFTLDLAGLNELTFTTLVFEDLDSPSGCFVVEEGFADCMPGEVFDPDFIEQSIESEFGSSDRLAIEISEIRLAPGAAPVIGDYNGNGAVDAADYVLWRDNLGGPAAALMNRDPSNTGPISQADYSSWRARFGATTGSGAFSHAAVPEPTSLLIFGLCALGMFVRRANSR